MLRQECVSVEKDDEQCAFYALNATVTPIVTFNLPVLSEKYSSTSKTSTMSSQTSRMRTAGFGMQLCEQEWRSTTSAQTVSESLKTSMPRLLVSSSSTAAQETGSEQQSGVWQGIFSMSHRRQLIYSETFWSAQLKQATFCISKHISFPSFYSTVQLKMDPLHM